MYFRQCYITRKVDLQGSVRGIKIWTRNTDYSPSAPCSYGFIGVYVNVKSLGKYVMMMNSGEGYLTINVTSKKNKQCKMKEYLNNF